MAHSPTAGESGQRVRVGTTGTIPVPARRPIEGFTPAGSGAETARRAADCEVRIPFSFCIAGLRGRPAGFRPFLGDSGESSPPSAGTRHALGSQRERRGASESGPPLPGCDNQRSALPTPPRTFPRSRTRSPAMLVIRGRRLDEFKFFSGDLAHGIRWGAEIAGGTRKRPPRFASPLNPPRLTRGAPTGYMECSRCRAVSPVHGAAFGLRPCSCEPGR
jgi:hypothetical protein